MTNDSRAPWQRFTSIELIGLVVVLVLGVLVGVTVSWATRTSHHELSKIFAGGAATLFFGALLGGVVTLLIAEFDRRRVLRAAQLDFISNVLADLKTVYDHVDRGRTLIQSHQSAKTYGDEMRNFIEARVKLRNVLRALNFDERGTPIIAAIRDRVASMEEYLTTLIDEFEEHYKRISRSQSLYEARMKKILEESAFSSDAEALLPKNRPWEAIAELPQVVDFILPLKDSTPLNPNPKSRYSRCFLEPLDLASQELRKALINEFSRDISKASRRSSS